MFPCIPSPEKKKKNSSLEQWDLWLHRKVFKNEAIIGTGWWRIAYALEQKKVPENRKMHLENKMWTFNW